MNFVRSRLVSFSRLFASKMLYQRKENFESAEITQFQRRTQTDMFELGCIASTGYACVC